MNKALLILALLCGVCHAQILVPILQTAPSGGAITVSLAGSYITNTNDTTRAVAISGGIPSGNGIFVVVLGACSTSVGPTLSATDNAGTPNTYQSDISIANGADNYTVTILSAFAANAIPSSTGTVTVTFGSACTTKGIYVLNSSTLNSTSWLDAGVTGSSTSSFGCAAGCTATAGSSVSQADIVIAGLVTVNTATITVTTGYTCLATNAVINTARDVSVCYKLVAAASGAPTVTGTLSSNQDFASALAAYKHP